MAAEEEEELMRMTFAEVLIVCVWGGGAVHVFLRGDTRITH